MEDDFDVLSEAICELLEQRLRQMEPPRHTWVERAVAWVENPIELSEEFAYRVIEENKQVQRATKPLPKWLH